MPAGASHFDNTQLLPSLDANEAYQDGYAVQDALGEAPQILTITEPPKNPNLHVGGLPTDITKRELAHIFRPFLGFQVWSPSSGVSYLTMTFSDGNHLTHCKLSSIWRAPVHLANSRAGHPACLVRTMHPHSLNPAGACPSSIVVPMQCCGSQVFIQ